MTKLYQFRLKVRKGPVTILNLSLLFSILALIISPHLVVIGAILMLILGYHVSFDKRDPDFASDNLERMVRNAGDNVRETVNDFTKGFESAFNDNEPQAQPQHQAQRGSYEEILHQAGETVKKTFNDVSRSFESAFNNSAQAQQPAADEPAPQPEAERSYYASNPAAVNHPPVYDPAAKVPTLQVPMQVESQDGNVHLDSDSDGYSSATVE